MYLNSPEIVVQPSVNDLKKVLGRLARNQVESSKPFVRWMSGTCIETPEVRGASDDDEPFVHTFFTDVSQNPQIVKTMLTLTHSTQKVIFGITRYCTLTHCCCSGTRAHSPVCQTCADLAVHQCCSCLPSLCRPKACDTMPRLSFQLSALQMCPGCPR